MAPDGPIKAKPPKDKVQVFEAQLTLMFSQWTSKSTSIKHVGFLHPPRRRPICVTIYDHMICLNGRAPLERQPLLNL